VSCWLCGNEKNNTHHLGCMRVLVPDLTLHRAVELGLVAAPADFELPPEPNTEVLKEGSMTTVPLEEAEGDGTVVGVCEYGDCENLKFSDSPRAKYCEEHRDPKNRKE